MLWEGKEVRTLSKNAPTRRYITFQPTRWCNWKCSYCIQGEVNIPKPADSELRGKALLLREAVDRADRVWPKTRENLNFIGGEVSCFDMPYILEPMLGPKTYFMCLTSNLSADPARYRDLHRFMQSRDVQSQFIFSFHEEFIKPDVFMGRLLEVRGMCPGAGVRAQVTVNSGNLDTSERLLSLCTEQGVDLEAAVERGARMEGKAHPPEVTDFVGQVLSLSEAQKNHGVPYNCELTFLDGSKVKARRNMLLAAGDSGGINTEGYTCRDRHSIIRTDKYGVISLNCRTRDDIMDEPDEMPCPKGRCTLCSRVVLEKMQ